MINALSSASTNENKSKKKRISIARSIEDTNRVPIVISAIHPSPDDYYSPSTLQLTRLHFTFAVHPDFRGSSARSSTMFAARRTRTIECVQVFLQ
jgi:hypothetical protein